TIIELMVSVVLGLILMLAALQVFDANKTTYRTVEALARVQENGRFAIQSIARDMRMAGYLGCASFRQVPVRVIANNAPANPSFATGAVVQSFNTLAEWGMAAANVADENGNNLTVCSDDIAASQTCQRSDVIAMVRGSDTSAITVADMTSTADLVTLRASSFNNFEGYENNATRNWGACSDDPLDPDDSGNDCNNDLFIVTDCLRADMFRNTQVAVVGGTQITLNPNANLQRNYDENSTVLAVLGATYFIADEAGAGADGVPSLYRMGITREDGTPPRAVEIARGVESMQVVFGVDNNNDNATDLYLNGAAITGANLWPAVKSVRINLVVKSESDRVTDVSVPWTTVDSNGNNLAINAAGPNRDRRLRMNFTTTIGLRNRVQ
ncbi:MAG: PilW family protein, partial [Gammaproteobacteria bacterium]|nr:PilW family protein [Gammaproteobacteria bacterium]